MRWLLLLFALPAAAANSPLTNEKWAFVRENPCPVTRYKTIACTGYVIAYPPCNPTRHWMRWLTLAAKPAWDVKAKAWCACAAYPVEVMNCTTRGCRALAVNCKL